MEYIREAEETSVTIGLMRSTNSNAVPIKEKALVVYTQEERDAWKIMTKEQKDAKKAEQAASLAKTPKIDKQKWSAPKSRKACFGCGSSFHIASECPDKSKYTGFPYKEQCLVCEPAKDKDSSDKIETDSVESVNFTEVLDMIEWNSEQLADLGIFVQEDNFYEPSLPVVTCMHSVFMIEEVLDDNLRGELTQKFDKYLLGLVLLPSKKQIMTQQDLISCKRFYDGSNGVPRSTGLTYVGDTIVQKNGPFDTNNIDESQWLLSFIKKVTLVPMSKTTDAGKSGEEAKLANTVETVDPKSSGVTTDDHARDSEKKSKKERLLNPVAMITAS
jgi:hypothetical protein